jgi:hypothetical protein
MSTQLRRLLSVTLFGLTVMSSTSVFALPTAYTARPLAVPRGTLRLDGGPRWPDHDAQLKQVVNSGPNQFFVNPGFAYGVQQDLEAGGVVPLRVEPDFQLENPRAYLLYQISPADPGLGIFGEVEVGIHSPFVLTLGVPALLKMGATTRFDFGGFMRIAFSGDGNSVDLVVPAYLPFQLGNRFFAGPEAAVIHRQAFTNLSDFAVPVGGFLGYTVGSPAGTFADLILRTRLLDPLDGLTPFEVMFAVEVYLGT